MFNERLERKLRLGIPSVVARDFVQAHKRFGDEAHAFRGAPFAIPSSGRSLMGNGRQSVEVL